MPDKKKVFWEFFPQIFIREEILNTVSIKKKIHDRSPSKRSRSFAKRKVSDTFSLQYSTNILHSIFISGEQMHVSCLLGNYKLQLQVAITSCKYKYKEVEEGGERAVKKGPSKIITT